MRLRHVTRDAPQPMPAAAGRIRCPPARPHDRERAPPVGFVRIAGVDEVGRGLPGRSRHGRGGRARPRPPHPGPARLEAAAARRARAAVRRDHAARAWRGPSRRSSPAEIDRINIHQASLRAMRRAVLALVPLPDLVLVDAFRIPDLPMAQRGVVHGDRPLLGHRRRLDRRQGPAGPADGGPARGRPPVRVRPPQGLRDGRAPAAPSRGYGYSAAHRRSFRPAVAVRQPRNLPAGPAEDAASDR